MNLYYDPVLIVLLLSFQAYNEMLLNQKALNPNLIDHLQAKLHLEKDGGPFLQRVKGME